MSVRINEEKSIDVTVDNFNEVSPDVHHRVVQLAIDYLVKLHAGYAVDALNTDLFSTDQASVRSKAADLEKVVSGLRPCTNQQAWRQYVEEYDEPPVLIDHLLFWASQVPQHMTIE